MVCKPMAKASLEDEAWITSYVDSGNLQWIMILHWIMLQHTFDSEWEVDRDSTLSLSSSEQNDYTNGSS